ncbi:hypothetical protein FPL03_24015 (plasmid) [Xanthomonas citri pv. glycines]|uniref:Uncharacterized protein n=1 Tax=Xanthomonas citri pv. vignicola TaxID=473426 RepID=A0AB33CQ38_XANCI|nr:hypothetical protein XcvCFBP7111P_25760 [Xanthomonas citri pv. vignicola]QDS14188.1 hypothetical protein FPL03_24015 [Xanthomonas citri pv. glycines]
MTRHAASVRSTPSRWPLAATPRPGWGQTPATGSFSHAVRHRHGYCGAWANANDHDLIPGYSAHLACATRAVVRAARWIKLESSVTCASRASSCTARSGNLLAARTARA